MKRTFTTIMPDKIGAFLKADRCIVNLGLNISRVSYNKAVDTHMLFIEVDGEEEKLNQCEKALTELGYINNDFKSGNVILIKFRLEDKKGALLPVLELINNYKFNISYMSSYENKSGYQDFKMGLFVENEKEISDFVSKAVELCPVEILNYNKSEKVLDNTVFYLSFANEISDRVGFSEDEKRALIINSNKIMQILDEKNLPPYKTFDYIGKFSDHLYKYKNENYKPRITEISLTDTVLLVVEPPCGSNVCVFIKEDTLIFVDSGFNLYKNELLNVLRCHIEEFDKKKKELMLTHSDVDHIGFLDWFLRVYLSKKTSVNLINVSNGKTGFREENPFHYPYVKISKILSKYNYPSCNNFFVIGDKKDDELLSFIGKVDFGNLTFEAYEGKGGHVRGETIYIERNKRLVFTGDLYVNVKGFTDEQVRFNKLAPYLMTSVDCEPLLATSIRKQIKPLLNKGKWTIIGGHGAPTVWDVL